MSNEQKRRSFVHYMLTASLYDKMETMLVIVELEVTDHPNRNYHKGENTCCRQGDSVLVCISRTLEPVQSAKH